jgi:hypothetical protein
LEITGTRIHYDDNNNQDNNYKSINEQIKQKECAELETWSQRQLSIENSPKPHRAVEW